MAAVHQLVPQDMEAVRQLVLQGMEAVHQPDHLGMGVEELRRHQHRLVPRPFSMQARGSVSS
jgi:hypothetical protein